MKRFVVIILSLFLTFSLFAEARNALLIANGDYKNDLPKLTNPVKEAKDLKVTLEKLGFSVTLRENISKEQMQDSLDDFKDKLEKSGGIGFFHYGGHGIQVDGKNYLIPVDAVILDEGRVKNRAVDVDEVMDSMQADTNIVILDACRDNPLPKKNRSVTATRGLALVSEKPKNSIIVFSADSGKVAQDGVFTPILAEKLLEQKSFTDIIRDVRTEVIKRTNGEQNPGSYDQLTNEVYLSGKPTVVSNSSGLANEYIEQGKKAFNRCDYKSAYENFSKLSLITDSVVQYDLGYMYYNGYGCTKNYKAAVDWFEKAAEQDNYRAMYYLGQIYENGCGVTKNLIIATEYYEQAAKLGYKEANAALQRIGNAKESNSSSGSGLPAKPKDSVSSSPSTQNSIISINNKNNSSSNYSNTMSSWNKFGLSLSKTVGWVLGVNLVEGARLNVSSGTRLSGYSETHGFNGFSGGGILTGKIDRIEIFRFMLGTSVSCSWKFEGYSYINWEILNAYFGIRNNWWGIFTGVGLGTVDVSYEFTPVSESIEASGTNFLISWHPIMAEYNFSIFHLWLKYNIDIMGGFPLVRQSLTLGISIAPDEI